MPAVLRALLADDALLAEIRRSAYETLRDELPIDQRIHSLVHALERASRADLGMSLPGRVQPIARPRPPQRPPPEPVRLAEARTEVDEVRAALKHVILAQGEIRRQLSRGGDSPARDRVERQGHRYRPHPRVSVLLTVYNYADVVGEAISSVAANDHDAFELVVVDDASTDGSLEAVRGALAEYPWLPATLIARGRNHGLAAARNLGVQHARAEYVFILDADNALYPHCLSTLAAALDEDVDAAFAYGILEVFDAGGPRDLKSWLAWDPYRFRYGNYIDAMALLRKSVVEEAGGYTSDRRLYGWEDFALWCALADRGLRGRAVPAIVARYRASLGSMISITNIDGAAAWTALSERYRILSEPAAP